jgi:hypothetical protein
MHQEATATERVGLFFWSEPQNVGAMFGGIYRRPSDRPVSLRDGADVRDGLHIGIVLAVTGSGISGSNVLAVLL